MFLRYFLFAEEVGEDGDDLGKRNSDPRNRISGSIFYVVFITICLKTLATRWAIHEDMSAHRTKATMKVKGCAQRSILQSNILFNLPVAAISVRMCIAK